MATADGSMALIALFGIASFPALGAADATPNLGGGVVDHVETVAVGREPPPGRPGRRGAHRRPQLGRRCPNPRPKVKAATPPSPKPAPAPRPAPLRPLRPPPAPAPSSGVWYSLAQCESGGNWAIASGNGFYGGLQFT